MTKPVSDGEAGAPVAPTVGRRDGAKGDVICPIPALRAVGLEFLIEDATATSDVPQGEHGPEVARILAVAFPLASGVDDPRGRRDGVTAFSKQPPAAVSRWAGSTSSIVISKPAGSSRSGTSTFPPTGAAMVVSPSEGVANRSHASAPLSSTGAHRATMSWDRGCGAGRSSDSMRAVATFDYPLSAMKSRRLAGKRVFRRPRILPRTNPRNFSGVK